MRGRVVVVAGLLALAVGCAADEPELTTTAERSRVALAAVAEDATLGTPLPVFADEVAGYLAHEAGGLAFVTVAAVDGGHEDVAQLCVGRDDVAAARACGFTSVSGLTRQHGRVEHPSLSAWGRGPLPEVVAWSDDPATLRAALERFEALARG